MEENKAPRKAKDNGYKLAFKTDTMFKEFINNFVDEDMHIGDNDIIETGTTQYLSVLQGERESDIVKLIHSKDKDYIILLEHQSNLDKIMPLRLLEYMAKIWQNQFQESKVLKPIVPIVLYTGKENWNIPKDFTNMFDEISIKGMDKFIPNFEYTTVNLKNYSFEQLKETRTSIGYVMMLDKLKHKEIFDDLKSAVDEDYINNITEHLNENEVNLLKDITTSFLNLSDDSNSKKYERSLLDMISEAENLWDIVGQRSREKGIEEGIEKGREEGIEKGTINTALSAVRIMIKLKATEKQVDEFLKTTGLSKESMEFVKNKVIEEFRSKKKNREEIER